MHQHAKLVFHEGLWHFQIANAWDTIRTWVDRSTALAELAEEGWEIIGPYPKHLGAVLKTHLGFAGYSLRRMIQ
jgi:hypothetical protein